MSARKILVADLFCGAGGSSSGARDAIEGMGRRMLLTCVNHWDLAIETHKRMHPEARHYCQDLAVVRPLDCVPEGKLDLLMASPTCTHHSRARGGRPTSDQQRMDPGHILTWLTELRVKRLLIENVPEFVEWGPVNPDDGKPIKSKKGQYFKAWCGMLEALGYRYEWRYLVCADYGDATTRKRFFLQARLDGKEIRWPEPTHFKDGSGDRRWRGARECIDWSIPGKSIFGRKRPLAPATIRRIYAGALRFGWPDPFIVVLRNHMAERSIDAPLPTISAEGTHIGIAQAVVISTRQHTGGPAPRSVDQPLPTATASDSRFGVVEPFVLSQASGGAPRNVMDPLPTIVAGGRGGSGTALIAPYYGSGSGETCKSADQPLDTVTALPRFGLVVPVTNGGWGAKARSTDQPLPTLTTAKGGELAFITASFGERDGQMPRVHSVDLPMPTLCAAGSVRMATAVHGQQIDIRFRMLHWRELARATSFSDAGQPDYEFVGTGRQITKQIGNAVPRKTARALVRAALWDMAA